MGIQYRSTFNAKKVGQDLVAARQRKLDQQLQIAAGEIVERTTAGKTVEGGTLAQYSKPHALYRARKGYQVSPPNLTIRGHMLAAITSEVLRQTSAFIGRIFFNSAREANKARGNQARRNFFGLSKKQISNITAALKSVRP